ncbi:hypothetical protein ZWY2020_004359 [Hordeum vulgare]|nr:hypothetical protein ZWY2020_004359 [Hordeum vulgare]
MCCCCGSGDFTDHDHGCRPLRFLLGLPFALLAVLVSIIRRHHLRSSEAAVELVKAPLHVAAWFTSKMPCSPLVKAPLPVARDRLAPPSLAHVLAGVAHVPRILVFIFSLGTYVRGIDRRMFLPGYDDSCSFLPLARSSVILSTGCLRIVTLLFVTVSSCRGSVSVGFFAWYSICVRLMWWMRCLLSVLLWMLITGILA